MSKFKIANHLKAINCYITLLIVILSTLSSFKIKMLGWREFETMMENCCLMINCWLVVLLSHVADILTYILKVQILIFSWSLRLRTLQTTFSGKIIFGVKFYILDFYQIFITFCWLILESEGSIRRYIFINYSYVWKKIVF